MRGRASVIPWEAIHDIVQRGLDEDLGTVGDLTTAGSVPDHVEVVGRIVARAPLVVCGLPAAESVFLSLGPDCLFEPVRQDGDWVQGENEVLATIEGPADLVLIGERLALNLMMHMSGIASRSRSFANHVQGKMSRQGVPVRIVSTRKTRPGLRAIERYAVTVGGCGNHRFGLFDGILVKDNHIAAAGGIAPALEEMRRYVHHGLRIEVEVETIEQAMEALEAGAEALLLDNMDPQTLTNTVDAIRSNHRFDAVLLEASGGVRLDTVATVADSGVDLISVGSLIHGAVFADLALELQPAHEQ